MPKYKIVQAWVCVGLILMVFAGLGMSGATGNMWWFGATAIVASLVTIGFVFFGPIRWME